MDILNNKDITVHTLRPSEELTSKIGEGAGCTAEEIEEMRPVAAGNPGAMNYLLELRKHFIPLDFKIVLSCLKTQNIVGPDFYLFVKNRGVDKAVKEMEGAWL